ncbi:BEL1-like homeodomain protein 1 [Olea europaea var. sylvestris]|uniref:BEL1-like homeodomain protein 1 n=1 Tax=Olea europaea var. sylvestris TaxID=158386 RepID=UPI000C1CD8E7|nr:BEL1-like homeodomain protein 1 [Olea europaea var. sylvestris]XP_022842438.1 BEL1-like homeodomain protein 1 [Olea europaea var. sylvestris]XP_022842439.1 BEL1-like homeodomain protein 1 [Olea europaea var. sylvestris]XP_022842440.1 BEL1-like homeodomain protein 1 [Olea europaea var. sylvestris]
MTTYFHGNSEIQGGGDGLQTLILMNPGFGYPDNQQPHPPGSNFVFLNSSTTGNSLNLPHAPPSQTQHFVGIPLQANSSTAASSQDPHAPPVHSQHDASPFHGFFPRVPYNLYAPSMDLTAGREVTRAQQGLSLSLSSQQPSGYGSFRPEHEVISQPLTTTVSPPRAGGDDVRISGGSPTQSSATASGISNGVNGMQSVLLSSKYLKAAQEVLDEVVSVGKGIIKSVSESAENPYGQAKNIGEPSPPHPAAGDGQSGGDTSAKRDTELTTAERQEIQMKKAKLLNMLDEVEQRYKQYHQQMHVVTSWFEQAAGIGSAKTYTALALQTISKQFRCLKDAILGQIRSASKSLGEDDGLIGKIEGSRLKYVDNQLRQQRALQQLGMIQHNAWRPQRGLPERSVSVLRAWLFEHFLHPYPKDSDKIMLAKQAGLTRSQVSNWFINARVRLWKPMVEEMYMEEVKEQEKTGPEEMTSKIEQNEDSVSKSTIPQEKRPIKENQNKNFVEKQENPMNQNTNPATLMSTASTSPAGATIRNNSGFNLIGSSEMESITQGSPKKTRSSVEMLHSPNSVPSINMDLKPIETNNEQISMSFMNERQSRGEFTLMGAPTNFISGFNSYPIEDIGRYDAQHFQAPYSGNGVSLTLGLPHCENLSISGTHQTFLPNQSIQLRRGLEIGEANEFGGMNAPTSPHSSNVYENINIQNRKRFAAQLLPDFVA